MADWDQTHDPVTVEPLPPPRPWYRDTGVRWALAFCLCVVLFAAVRG